MLREDLILIDADSLRLSAKLAGPRLRVEAGVQPEAPHRIDMLRFFPDGEPVTDTRITQPPSASSGPVLGQLIADLTGTSFARAATRLVLEPLGMADSWFPAEPPVSPDAACGYLLDEEGSLEREQPQVFALQSAGGLWSTGPDLVRFGSGWRTLLPAELAAEALRPQGPRRDAVEETGLGWGLRRSMDAVGQAGIGPGWAASLILRPSTGRTIAVLTNRLFPVLALNAELVRSAT